MSELKKYKLGDLGFFFGGVTSIKKEDYGHGTPFLPYKNVYRNSKVNVNELELMNVRPLDLERRNAVYGDIFFTASSETPDEVAMSSVLLDEVENLTFNGFCKRFRLNDFNTLLPEYARYLFRDISFRREVYQLATGDIRFNISQESLANIEIEIPDLPTQRQIAQILTLLDDKIELNLQMNQTLEAMAQAIFKEWFVNFNFPGFDGELVDGLPKGWRMGKLGDISKVIDCLHSKKPERIGEKTGNILLQLNNIIDNGLLDISEIFWISDDDYKKWISRIEISQGDCVITNVGRVGAVARIPLGIKAAIGRNMTGIRLKEEYPYPGFLITLMKSDLIKMEIEQKKDIGTILEALNVKNIPNLSFPIPTHHIFKEFETIVSKIWDKMEDNTAQNLSLTQTRDILLPKLMSGQLAVV